MDEEVRRALDSIDEEEVHEVCIFLEDKKTQVSFDYTKHIDSPQSIVEEMRQGAIVPDDYPLERLKHEIEKAIVARCEQINLQRRVAAQQPLHDGANQGLVGEPAPEASAGSAARPRDAEERSAQEVDVAQEHHEELSRESAGENNAKDLVFLQQALRYLMPEGLALKEKEFRHGEWCQVTQEAVEWFQRSNSLLERSVVDDAFWQILTDLTEQKRREEQAKTEERERSLLQARMEEQAKLAEEQRQAAQAEEKERQRQAAAAMVQEKRAQAKALQAEEASKMQAKMMGDLTSSLTKPPRRRRPPR